MDAASLLTPGFDHFTSCYDLGKSQVIRQWISADLDTPVSAYLKLCENETFSFLLESVEGGAVLGRYSAIGLRPDFFWRYQNGKAETSTNSNDWQHAGDAALNSLKQAVRECRIDSIDEDLPPMAPSGLFGYLGYDMIRLVEDIPDKNPDELGIPEGLMIRPTVMVIFDNVRHMMCLSAPVRPQQGVSARAAYEQAAALIGEIYAKLTGPVPVTYTRATTTRTLPLAPQSNFSREAYHKTVEKAVEAIYAGEIFQIVLSQRFTADFDLPSFALYRALRQLNPSPFLFHLNFGGFALVGSSPEILVRVRGGQVTIRPIAGTRRRGVNAKEDKALAEDLLGDEKERAEHLMLLDLGRNDVGRVAEIGSVDVTDRFIIEYYSHVMHIVSNVEGRLRPDVDPLDALFAGFPAGTVSGAPKIRAMELIDELEPVKRSFYAGCIGYLDGNGDVDTCIALRTALVKDGQLYIQAGGGVVADSDPEFEYQECHNKARALVKAAEQAIAAAQELHRRAS